METLNVRKAFLAVAACLSLSACGDGKLITGADLSASVDQGQILMDLVTHLESQNIRFPVMQIPILNPHNPAEILGQLSLSSPAVGKTDVGLKVNLTQVASLPYLTPEKGLPNGTAFPVIGVDASKWYSLPLGGSKSSKLYLNIDQVTQRAVVGYTLASDGLSTGLVANLFLPFQSTTVAGYGGVYSSPNPGQSGFALFADVSAVLKTQAHSVQSLSRVGFKDATPEKKKETVQRKIIDLNLKKALLKLR
ncbi:hypothetical protein [Bdellovibrio sp. HCB2-146]|uniref:hypothetical protein n=1 Tax=Bdellovibrio sp. HCB2-146 TaxID=3394362 RepID=UPI0039BCECF5